MQTYAYDTANRFSTITSPAGACSYTYDPMCHLLVGRVSQPPGSAITNAFDSLARLTGTYLRHSGGTLLNSHAYTYDDANRRTRQTRTGGDYVDYGYDNIGQLKTANGKESGGTTNRWLEQLGYAYDAAGNLTNRTNNALTQAFACDVQNQLTSVSRSGQQTVAGVTWGAATNVTVADNGNSPVAAQRYADNTFTRTNVTLLDGTNTFVAVAQDAYGRSDTNTSVSWLPASVSYAYDGNGNMTTNGTRVFAYDDENQLTSITEPGAWKSEFTYDGRMRRRLRKEYTWRHSAWVQTNEVRYVYDGKLPIQERYHHPQLSTTVPQQSVTYTRGRDLSGTLEGAGGIGGLLARTDSALLALGETTAHAYYHADGNGNVTALVASNQVLAAKYLFDPFGRILAAVGPLAEANLYRFSSKELHVNSGCVYYLYRLYDPNAQRWMNRDPIMEIADVNLYRNCLNSPVNYFDQDGRAIPFLGPLIGKAIRGGGRIGGAWVPLQCNIADDLIIKALDGSCLYRYVTFLCRTAHPADEAGDLFATRVKAPCCGPPDLNSPDAVQLTPQDLNNLINQNPGAVPPLSPP